VKYRCGLNTFSEWICLDHPGFAGTKAARWWRRRFEGKIPTVDKALEDIFLPTSLATMTTSITVQKRGKYPEITSIDLHGQPEGTYNQ